MAGIGLPGHVRGQTPDVSERAEDRADFVTIARAPPEPT
jgi:hypothetical protein